MAAGFLTGRGLQAVGGRLRRSMKSIMHHVGEIFQSLKGVLADLVTQGSLCRTGYHEVDAHGLDLGQPFRHA